MRQIFARLLSSGLLAAGGLFAWQIAMPAGAPGVPSNICIVKSTGSTCAAGKMKWNPGHYVRPEALAFPENDGSRQAQYAQIKNDPMFKGGLITVPWGVVEQTQGVYDFSQIDKDLAYLKSIGKKLIIEIWWQKYGYGSTPDTKFFPKYIVDAGGIGAITGQNERHIKINEQAWSDRYVALQKAMAAKYDSDPDVEQIVITETASTSAYQFKQIVPAVGQLWHRTSVVLYMNWVDTPELARDLMALCAQNGVGMGAPDILPPKPISHTGEDNGSRALRGVGRDSLYNDGENMGDFGTTDYRGVIPVSYSYEWLQNLPPASLINYITDTLKATHVVWSGQTSGDSTMNWSGGVVPTVHAANGRVTTALPSAYAGR